MRNGLGCRGLLLLAIGWPGLTLPAPASAAPGATDSDRGLAEPGANAWFSEAARLRSEKRYPELLSLLRPRADAGEPLAQSLLGNLYAGGEGMTRDYAQAAMWWHRAAAAGNVSAQSRLGLAYATGQGVLEDLDTAATWLTKAASAGEAEAQYNLGRLDLRTAGVDRNYVTGLRWLRLAAAQGHQDAARLLTELGQSSGAQPPPPGPPPTPPPSPAPTAALDQSGLFFAGTEKGRKAAWMPVVIELQNLATLSGAWVRELPSGLPFPANRAPGPGEVLASLRSSGNSGWLLYVRVIMHSGAPSWGLDQVQVECYDPEGTLLWKEKASNKMGVAKRPIQKINQRISAKLAGRRGGPCLRSER